MHFKLARCLDESGDEPAAIVELRRLATKGWGAEAGEARALEQLGVTDGASET